MAKGKQDAKKKAEKKARVAQKQVKKASQKEKKNSKKPKNDADDSDVDDADLDAILAEYQKQQEQFLKVTESTCDAPAPRTSATICASPSNANELFLFGGESFNGSLASFYNDLYIYKINADSWRKCTSPNSPLPRSGHAMCQGGNAGGIYLFGGEFSSPKQGTFYHYNDLWHLDPATREWTKLEAKGGPPARSGHRLVAWKQYIVLIGGFQDTSQQTKYLQDVWLYNTNTFSWHCPLLPPSSQKPDARSSFSLLPHEGGAVMYGGYSRVKVHVTSGKTSKAGKGVVTSASKITMKPVVHQDTWFLRITPPPADAPSNTLPTVRWEKRKRPVNAPNPARAGATMAHHKGRGLSFGGVHDVEESDEGIDSEFFNQLFAYNIDRNRFFPLSLRRPRTSAKKVIAGNERGGRRGRGKADEEELLRNLALIEQKGDLDSSENVEMKVTDANSEDKDDEETQIQKPVTWEFPHPRFNAQLAVQEDQLYIYGGTFEKGDREFTFDELWSIDLGRLDGCKQLFKRQDITEWLGTTDENDEDESDDEEEDDDDDDDDEDDGDDDEKNFDSNEETPSEPETPASSISTPLSLPSSGAPPVEDDNDPSAKDPVKDDGLPSPRPFETLRDFFTRTSNEWQEIELHAMKYRPAADVEATSVKEIRKKAFERAEDKWWDSREEVQALEDEQERAGIGEVVSLADKEGGGVGRRR